MKIVILVLICMIFIFRYLCIKFHLICDYKKIKRQYTGCGFLAITKQCIKCGNIKIVI